MFSNFFDFNQLILWLPGVLIALTLHEYAHGRVADWLGDPTPRYQGRLTLNPLAHLDPLGFLMLLLVHFGWAKPVQVNPMNFRGDRYRGMVLVSLAGIGMNLLVAFTVTLIATLAFSSNATGTMVDMIIDIIFINIYLAVFNIIPIPPLDGSQFLAGLLRRSDLVYSLQRYGFVLLILLILPIFGGNSIIGIVLGPISVAIFTIFSAISQVIAHLIGF